MSGQMQSHQVLGAADKPNIADFPLAVFYFWSLGLFEHAICFKRIHVFLVPRDWHIYVLLVYSEVIERR